MHCPAGPLAAAFNGQGAPAFAVPFWPFRPFWRPENPGRLPGRRTQLSNFHHDMPAPFLQPFALLERECKSPTRTFNRPAIFAPSPAPIPAKQAAGSGIRRESRRISLGFLRANGRLQGARRRGPRSPIPLPLKRRLHGGSPTVNPKIFNAVLLNSHRMENLKI